MFQSGVKNPANKAQMVELVDTLVSGTSAVKSMEVRVFFWADKNKRLAI